MTEIRELILGGDGLIGTALAETLRAQGREVVSLDLKSGFDLRQPFDLAPFENCDRVWFLAWDTGGAKYLEAENQQHQQYRNNCEISLRVFDALSRTKKPFLFVTSQLAGQPNAYGTTKLMAWHWSENLGGKVARLWNTYGWEHPDVRSHVVTDLVLSGLTKGRVTCLTSGLERRRFIYKSDSVAALIRLFDGPAQTAEIAGSEWITIRQAGEEVARQLQVEFEPGVAAGSEVMIDPQEVLPGWEPQVNFREGVSFVIGDARDYLREKSLTQSANSDARKI